MLNNEASREALKKAKRIVIKVGTSTITYANGKRNFSQIDRLAREISDLQNQGKEMILVTSGAVAMGVDRMGLPGKPKTIPGKQAAAAVGQGVLMHTYEKFFADYGQIVAQVLITKTEAIDRHRYTNTRNTFMELMRQRVIPIVNENDVVALMRQFSEHPERLPKIYHCCGTEDRLYRDNVLYRDLAQSIGADVTWEELPGGHTWEIWDACIPHALEVLTSK